MLDANLRTREAWRTFGARAGGPLGEAFEAFVEADDQRPWLSDWCRFAALKAARGGGAGTEWDPSRRVSGDETRYHAFLQFLFFRQWERLRAEARRRGIALLGDVPIYVAFDSADVWAHPEMFDLDGDGRPIHVAGVPPDYFSETGQRVGESALPVGSHGRGRFRVVGRQDPRQRPADPPKQ